MPCQPGHPPLLVGPQRRVQPWRRGRTAADAAMPATRPARSASGPSATTVTVSPSISAEPARTAPSASITRIRVRGGRRSFSSSAGSSVTQRPRSRISGRFASASSVISSGSSSSPPRVSCQWNSSSASRLNPALRQPSGDGVATARSLSPSASRLDGHSTSMPTPASSSAEGPSSKLPRRRRAPGLTGGPAPATGPAAATPRRRAAGPAADPSRPARRTWRARSPAGPTGRRRPRSGSGRRCCAAAAPAGTPARSRQVVKAPVEAAPAMRHRRGFHPRARHGGSVLVIHKAVGSAIGQPRPEGPGARPRKGRPRCRQATPPDRRPGSARARRTLRGNRVRCRGGPHQRVRDRIPQCTDQRLRGVDPHRARTGDREGVRRRRETASQLVEPGKVGRVQRPRPPDIHATQADRGQQPAAGHQTNAGGRGRRPHPDGSPHRSPGRAGRIGIDGQQRRQSLRQRNKVAETRRLRTP